MCNFFFFFFNTLWQMLLSFSSSFVLVAYYKFLMAHGAHGVLNNSRYKLRQYSQILCNRYFPCTRERLTSDIIRFQFKASYISFRQATYSQ